MQLDHPQSSTGPLTVGMENMADAENDCVIGDARRANTKLHIRDSSGKVLKNYTEILYRGIETLYKTPEKQKHPKYI